MKLCKVGIHKWVYAAPVVTHLKYRTCKVCGKHQVKQQYKLSFIPIWWTENK
jgi:hypothetical protein